MFHGKERRLINDQTYGSKKGGIWKFLENLIEIFIKFMARK